MQYQVITLKYLAALLLGKVKSASIRLLLMQEMTLTRQDAPLLQSGACLSGIAHKPFPLQ